MVAQVVNTTHDMGMEETSLRALRLCERRSYHRHLGGRSTHHGTIRNGHGETQGTVEPKLWKGGIRQSNIVPGHPDFLRRRWHHTTPGTLRKKGLGTVQSDKNNQEAHTSHLHDLTASEGIVQASAEGLSVITIATISDDNHIGRRSASSAATTDVGQPNTYCEYDDEYPTEEGFAAFLAKLRRP